MKVRRKDSGIKSATVDDKSSRRRLYWYGALVIVALAAGIPLIVTKAASPAASIDICPTTPVIGNAIIASDGAASCGASVAFGGRPSSFTVSLATVATGTSSPTEIANSGVPGDTRLFINGQTGKIYVSPNDGSNISSNVFLDISSKVKAGGEQGFLGLTFDPAYAQNGYFYVYYTTSLANVGTFNGQTISTADIILERYTRSAADPNKADPNSGLIILGVDDPENNHNGGGLRFGTDGYLYVSIGDGGGAGDKHTNNCVYGNAQCLNSFLGKILRLDVRGASTAQRYKVPPDNPFVSTAGAYPEIWFYGLRNPWRYSFDSQTQDMFIGDVGQNQYEEIDFVPAGAKGKNFGWRCLEATHVYDSSANAACTGMGAATNYIVPIYEYDHSAGCSVTGGFIYRGNAHPAFNGTYVFSDYCTSKLWFLNKNSSGSWAISQTADVGLPGNSVGSFGQDINGEIYVAALGTGTIYRINVSP